MADLEPGAGGIPKEGIYGPTKQDIADSSKRSKVLDVLGSERAKPAVKAIAGAATLGGIALGAHEDPAVVSAATPTPDAIGTKIAGDKKAAENRLNQARDLAETTNINQQIERILNPTKEPAKTSTLTPSDAETIRLKALGNKQAEIKATATAEAELTATPAARLTATAEARQAVADETARLRLERERNQGGSPGILGFLAAIGLGVGGTLGFIHRDRIAGRVPPPLIARVAAAVTAIRARLHI